MISTGKYQEIEAVTISIRIIVLKFNKRTDACSHVGLTAYTTHLSVTTYNSSDGPLHLEKHFICDHNIIKWNLYFKWQNISYISYALIIANFMFQMATLQQFGNCLKSRISLFSNLCSYSSGKVFNIKR